MKWSVLKAFYRNQVVKVSYAILVGFPILLEILNPIKLTFEQIVYNVFYSSALIIISFLIYNIAAPKQIANYSDYHEYVEKLKPSLLSYNPDKQKNVVLAHLDETEISQRNRIEALYQEWENETDLNKRRSLENAINKIVKPIYPTCVNRFLEKEWFKKDETNKVALFICFLLAAAGALLALWVLFERIKIVITNNF